MKCIVTPHELFERGLWEKFCEVTKSNLYAVSEGLIDVNDGILLTEKQAKEIGLIK